MSSKTRKSDAKERVSPEEFYALQKELEETKRQYGVVDEPVPEGRISRMISGFFDRRAAQQKISVRKRTYLLLAIFTGIVGGHRFYTRKWTSAILYLLTCWCGFSIAMTIVDLLIVIPMKPDENGCILM